MTNRTVRLRSCLAAAALMTLPVASHATPAPAALATLAGSWTVTHVRSDATTGRKTALPPDDPSLVGRQLAITANSVTLQTLQGPQQCGGATLSAKSEAVSGLLAGGDGAGGSNPSDYGLPLAAGATVDALFLSCATGGVGASVGTPGAGGTWLLRLADGTLVMNYIDGALLILSRGDAAPSGASFDCAHASNASEHAICGSADLAALDRSIAQAYRGDARQFQGIGDPAASAKLRSSQKAWLRQRDACGGDDTCLHRVMDQRLQALGDTQSFTGE